MLKMNPQEALKCATDMLFALDDDGGSTSSTLLAAADALKLKDRGDRHSTVEETQAEAGETRES